MIGERLCDEEDELVRERVRHVRIRGARVALDDRMTRVVRVVDEEEPVARIVRMEREAKDRLSEANYRVGYFYFRVRWYLGAIDRFKDVLATDPAFTNRDAVYFHLAESLYRENKKPEALPYFERLVKEFEKSEYLEASQKRIAELKAELKNPA